MNLEEAIQKVIELRRRKIHKEHNPIYNKSLEVKIQTFEKAPRNKRKLHDLIIDKKYAANNSEDIYSSQTLLWELDSLEHIYHMIEMIEHGEPVEGLVR